MCGWCSPRNRQRRSSRGAIRTISLPAVTSIWRFFSRVGDGKPIESKDELSNGILRARPINSLVFVSAGHPGSTQGSIRCAAWFYQSDVALGLSITGVLSAGSTCEKLMPRRAPIMPVAATAPASSTLRIRVKAVAAIQRLKDAAVW